MKTIFKTWKKATYFEGAFQLRDRTQVNWAHPIEFPTVFTAYGHAIENGDWESYTSINTPTYVIDYWFDGLGDNKHDAMFQLWQYCKKLAVLTWEDVETDKDKVLNLVNLANKELNKLQSLKYLFS